MLATAGIDEGLVNFILTLLAGYLAIVLIAMVIAVVIIVLAFRAVTRP